MREADHQESSPDASFPLISKLSCSLVGERKIVRITPGSHAHRIYDGDESEEVFACNYGLNRDYDEDIKKSGLRITGYDDDGAVRIVELPHHRFFVATLFVPQARSTSEKPHPLIVAYVKAAFEFQR